MNILRIRLGPLTRGFKRESQKKKRRSLARPPQMERVSGYFELFTGALGIAVSFARIESVCSASPRSSSLYF
jgi:hypothetical protein